MKKFLLSCDNKESLHAMPIIYLLSVNIQILFVVTINFKFKLLLPAMMTRLSAIKFKLPLPGPFLFRYLGHWLPRLSYISLVTIVKPTNIITSNYSSPDRLGGDSLVFLQKGERSRADSYLIAHSHGQLERKSTSILAVGALSALLS